MKVSSQIVFAVARYLRLVKADPQALATRLGLPGECVETPEATLEAGAQEAFLEAAAAETGDPHVGLTAARHLDPGTFGLLGFLCASSDNMRQVLERTCRYFTVLHPNNRVHLDERPEGPQLVHTVRGAPHGLGRHCNELTLASMVEVGRQLSGEGWGTRAIWFAHEGEPDDTLVRFFGTSEIAFGQESNGFVFSPSFLERDVKGSNPALAAFLEQLAKERAPAPPPEDIVEQVAAAIRAALPDGAPSIERLAMRMGLSARTLQRRLDERGTQFARLLEDTRRELAERYLADPDRPISEIAFRLGYAQPPAFLRAYKRWTGRTPGETRARAR